MNTSINSSTFNLSSHFEHAFPFGTEPTKQKLNRNKPFGSNFRPKWPFVYPVIRSTIASLSTTSLCRDSSDRFLQRASAEYRLKSKEGAECRKERAIRAKWKDEDRAV